MRFCKARESNRIFLQASDTYLDIKVISKVRRQISKLITVHIVANSPRDDAPHWLHNPIYFVVPENSPPGTFVGVLRTKEANNGSNGSSIQYELKGNGLSVDSTTGVIRTTIVFDYEKVSIIILSHLKTKISELTF